MNAKIVDMKNAQEYVKEKVTEIKTMCLEIKNQAATSKNEIDVKISEVKDQLVNDIKNSKDQLTNDIKNSKNEVVEKTTGIQQQLVVYSNELKNIIQSVNQLKATIPAVVNHQQPSPQQQQALQQPISTQGIVINGTSSLIMSSHFDKLKEWIPKHASLNTCRLDLLYKGSRDGFKAQTFHQMCDSRSPTIIFIKSQTYGRIFGGYTAQTWNHTAGYTKDEKAFLFSLTHNEKYPVADPDKAIFGRNDFSATFGAGNDLHISDSSNTKAGSCTGFPYSYKCSKFTTVTEESKAYLAGSCWFTVEEIEVYQIV